MLTCKINRTVLCVAVVALTVWTAPDLAQAIPGDVSGDGNIDNLDIEPFEVAVDIEDEAAFLVLYPAGDYWAADTQADGCVDNLDITPFIALLTEQPLPTGGQPFTAFLSAVTTIGGGAALGTPELTVDVGNTIALGLWISAPVDQQVNGLALDLVETAGILSGTGLQIMESGMAGFLARWAVTRDPNMNVSSTDLFTRGVAFGVENIGLTKYQTMRTFDGNFDANVTADGAFLYAILEMTALTEGDSNLFLRVGNKRIGAWPDDDANIYLGAGDAAIDRTVIGATSALPDAIIHVVPEPATLAMLTLGGVALLRRRSGQVIRRRSRQR